MPRETFSGILDPSGALFLGADALSYLFVDQMDFVNSVAWIFTGISGAELLLLHTVFRRKQPGTACSRKNRISDSFPEIILFRKKNSISA